MNFPFIHIFWCGFAVSWIACVITSGFDLSLSWAIDFWSTLNYFFPVNESLAMLTVVYAYWLTCFLIKVTLKAVPTVY